MPEESEYGILRQLYTYVYMSIWTTFIAAHMLSKKEKNSDEYHGANGFDCFVFVFFLSISSSIFCFEWRKNRAHCNAFQFTKFVCRHRERREIFHESKTVLAESKRKKREKVCTLGCKNLTQTRHTYTSRRHTRNPYWMHACCGHLR